MLLSIPCCSAQEIRALDRNGIPGEEVDAQHTEEIACFVCHRWGGSQCYSRRPCARPWSWSIQPCLWQLLYQRAAGETQWKRWTFLDAWARLSHDVPISGRVPSDQAWQPTHRGWYQSNLQPDYGRENVEGERATLDLRDCIKPTKRHRCGQDWLHAARCKEAKCALHWFQPKAHHEIGPGSRWPDLLPREVRFRAQKAVWVSLQPLPRLLLSQSDTGVWGTDSRHPRADRWSSIQLFRSNYRPRVIPGSRGLNNPRSAN